MHTDQAAPRRNLSLSPGADLLEPELRDARVKVRRVLFEPLQRGVDQQAGDPVASKVLLDGQPAELYVRLPAVVVRGRPVGRKGGRAAAVLTPGRAGGGLLAAALEDVVPVAAAADGMGAVRKGHEADGADGGAAREALARLDDGARLVADLVLLGGVDAGVGDPVAAARVVDVELVVDGDALLLDEDVVAHLGGVEEGGGYLGGLLLARRAWPVALELARLDERDERRSHGGSTRDVLFQQFDGVCEGESEGCWDLE